LRRVLHVLRRYAGRVITEILARESASGRMSRNATPQADH